MKKLIIVCEDKLSKHGNFLAQLISLSDDNESHIVGVKDGSVEATVWDEKHYVSNATQISSNQSVIFIGNSKMMAEKRLHMLNQFSEYGMNYCWLGTQASLFVDKKLTIDEYKEFINSAQQYNNDIKLLVEKKEDAVLVVDKHEKENLLNKFVDKMKAVPVALANMPNDAINKLQVAKKYKEIENQQYSCAVLLFYLNGLKQFLGL